MHILLISLAESMQKWCREITVQLVYQNQPISNHTSNKSQGGNDCDKQ